MTCIEEEIWGGACPYTQTPIELIIIFALILFIIYWFFGRENKEVNNMDVKEQMAEYSLYKRWKVAFLICFFLLIVITVIFLLTIQNYSQTYASCLKQICDGACIPNLVNPMVFNRT